MGAGGIDLEPRPSTPDSRKTLSKLATPSRRCAAGGRGGSDGNARATVWESRKSPGLSKKARESITLPRALIWLLL